MESISLSSLRVNAPRRANAALRIKSTLRAVLTVLTSLTAIIFTIFALTGCKKTIAVTSIRLDKTSLTLTEGESANLTATVSPSDATVGTYSWSSSDPSVASVNSGVVKALKAGSATITVTTTDGGKSASCSVTVKSAKISVTGVTLDQTSLELVEGKTATLKATVAPSNATDPSVSWSSSDKGVATVDSNGGIIAVKAGSAIITVTTTDGGKTASCAVTVKPAKISVTGVALDKTSASLLVGQTQQLKATVTPENATDKSVSWSSSNANIASVDNAGLVTAQKPGSATITVVTTDGSKMATCDFTITQPVSGVTLDKSTLTLTEGDNATLTATVSPEDASNKEVSWSTSDAGIVSLDQTGNVLTVKATAVKEGTAKITVTTKDGNHTASCEVTVNKKVIKATGVTLDKTSIELVEGETATLSATIEPSDATDKTLTWSSNNVLVATVDQNGKVSAIIPGQAMITVMTSNSFSASCIVSVAAKPVSVTGITLDKTSLEMTIGKSEIITAKVSPSNATDRSVTWTSSNPDVATVSSSGLVYGIAEGSATITAKTTDGGFTATCSVNVNKPNVFVTGVTLDKTELSLVEGETATLKASVIPEDATDKSLVWSTDNSFFASVDQNGNVTAVNEGTTRINVRTSNFYYAHCTVTVTAKAVSVTGIALDEASASIGIGDTHQLTATLSPSNATNKSIAWTSSNNGVATVSSSGLVTGVANGSAIITARTDDGGFTAQCQVTVATIIVSPTGVTLDKTELSLLTGTTASLTATIQPSNATDKSLDWSTNNSYVATVDQNGNVTAVNEGTATISVRTSNSHYAYCTVTVTAKAVSVTGITLNETSASIGIGGDCQLKATITPSNATNKNVAWTSSNSSIATVSSTGFVTGVAAGTATITAKTADGGYTAQCQVTVVEGNVDPTGVSLDRTSLSLVEGSTATLTATIQPSNATDKSLVWSTNNSYVATVDQNGNVTAVKEGTAQISVRTSNFYYAYCTVTVTAKAVSVTGVSVSPTSVTINVRGTEQISATISPSNATNKNITWTSSNSGIATVSSSGLVTGVAAGTATITAKTADGGYTAQCQVTVVEGTVSPTGITLDRTSLSLVEGSTATLTATIQPSNATDKSLVWSTNNDYYATVDQNGKVTAVNEGTAQISVRTSNFYYAYCTVTVTAKVVSVTGVSVSPTSVTINVRGTQQISATISPSNATNKSITWTSSNSGIATVSSSGLVTGVAAGTATITAKTADGGYTAQCQVTVVEGNVDPTGVSLDKTELSLVEGSTATLTATIQPSNATDKSLVWSTDNDYYATVDQNGNVTAVGAGTTVINVRTSNFYWAHCTITVTAKPVSVTGVSVSPTSATIDIKGTKQLSATISPSNATDKSVTWSSSNSSVAKVSSSGLVTGVANGSATITAKTSDGGYTATCAITVNTVIITIKDAKFKSYLVSNFDTNGDGEISTVEAAVVTTISCPAVGISFLDGIEYFTSLQFLSVNSNSLTTESQQEHKADGTAMLQQLPVQPGHKQEYRADDSAMLHEPSIEP